MSWFSYRFPDTDSAHFLTLKIIFNVDFNVILTYCMMRYFLSLNSRCSYLQCLSVFLSLFGPGGTDSEPKVDFRVDESSDIPILEDRSSSPIDFPPDQWLVGTDIENIERYTHCASFSHLFSFLMQQDLFFVVLLLFYRIIQFDCKYNLLIQCFSVFTETCERWEIYSANSGRRCHCHWKIKVCNWS